MVSSKSIPSGKNSFIEAKLNEIYNVIDLYLHPVTSGGLEIPIIENLLAANALLKSPPSPTPIDAVNNPTTP
jgi:hypothetical protein